MTGYDEFAADLAGWLDDEARAPAPTGGLHRTLAAISRHRPRPGRLARFGSHWIAEQSPTASLHGDWQSLAPGLRFSPAIAVALVLVLAFVGTAMLISSRLLEPRPLLPRTLGLLAYGLDGDIYVSDWDGGNPVRIADGAPSGGSHGFSMHESAAWSPDGRHLLYMEDTQGSDIAHISDPSGSVVGSFEVNSGDYWPALEWSPDSTRLQGWAGDGEGIGVYGLDGRQEAFMELPDGYERRYESGASWAPDGRSVAIHLHNTKNLVTGEYWELPIDGPPRELAIGDPRISIEHAFTRDGRRAVFATDDGLFVANADGSDRRVVVASVSAGQPKGPKWSPDETQVLFVWDTSHDVGGTFVPETALEIVDVASGTIEILVAGLPLFVSSFGWSPEGDRILFMTSTWEGHASIWTVNRDGSGRRMLLDDSSYAGWQWKQP
jgi:Tol biopolymer transport system component